MHAACCDILTWWENNRLNGEPQLNDREDLARNTKVSSRVPHSDEIEMYYDLHRPEEEQAAERPTSDQEKTIITADQFVRVKHRIAAYEKMQKELSGDHDESYDTENPISSSCKTMHSSENTKQDRYTTTSEQTGAPCAPPWAPQEVINYVTSMYRSFDQRSYKELSSCEISFETWVRWKEYEHRTRI